MKGLDLIILKALTESRLSIEDILYLLVMKEFLGDQYLQLATDEHLFSEWFVTIRDELLDLERRRSATFNGYQYDESLGVELIPMGDSLDHETVITKLNLVEIT